MGENCEEIPEVESLEDHPQVMEKDVTYDGAKHIKSGKSVSAKL